MRADGALRLLLLAALPATLGAPPRHALAPPLPPPPQEHLVEGQGPGFTWSAPPELGRVARRFAPEVGGLLQDARRWLGLPLEAPPARLDWVLDREGLAAALGQPVPSWYAAVTLPGQRRMILATRVAGTEGRLRATLRHEILHLAMADIGPAAWRRLPAWFHEGCAEVWSGEIYLEDVGISLAWRAWTGDLPYLSAYREGFGREPLRAALGYRLGEAFVARLIREQGEGVVPALLREVAAGASLDEALVTVTGLSLETHEQALRAELGSLRSLLAEAQPQIFLLLMLAALVLAPFVWRARRRRRAELEERWARQERLDRLDPVIVSGQWQEPDPDGEDEEDPDEDAEALDGWVEEPW